MYPVLLNVDPTQQQPRVQALSGPDDSIFDQVHPGICITKNT